MDFPEALKNRDLMANISIRTAIGKMTQLDLKQKDEVAKVAKDAFDKGVVQWENNYLVLAVGSEEAKRLEAHMSTGPRGERRPVPTPQTIAHYWYFASPYSKYPDGSAAAYELACVNSALLLAHHVPHYCPIVACHPLVEYVPHLDPKDFTHWRHQNEAMMLSAKGIIMLRGKNWENSDGMMDEWKFFALRNLEVVYMDPGVLPAEFIGKGYV